MKDLLFKWIGQFTKIPRKLFLIDGLGALLSAFLLGIVLVQFESTFGMPRKTLCFLAFLPCLFAIYDFVCYFRFPNHWKFALKGIAIANLGYCCISIGMLVFHFSELTIFGWIYFLVEVFVVAVLAVVELWVSE